MVQILRFLTLILLSFTPMFGQENEKKEAPLSSYFDELEKSEAETPDRFFQEFLNMLLLLAGIIFLVLATAWFLKKTMKTRMLQQSASSEITLLESRPLTPKTVLHLVEIKGTTYAFTETQNSVSSLTEIRECSEKINVEI